MAWLWIDFVHSDWRDPRGGGRRDRLDDPRWIAGLASDWHLAGLKTTDRAALGRLRQAIQRAVQALGAGKRIPPRELAVLNEALAAETVTQRLAQGTGGYRLELHRGSRGAASALREIAGSFAKFVVEEDVSRLKCCENSDCRWVFHDETRSRTRRWCDASCGNLIRVREFRSKRC